MTQAPFGFSPELLAQLGIAGFKPPQSMIMPGMQAPQMGGGGDGGLGGGMAGLGMGLGMMGRMEPTNAGPQGSGTGGAYTAADATSMAGMGGDPSGATFGAPAGLGTPGQSGGGPLAWIRRQLGLVDPLTGM